MKKNILFLSFFLTGCFNSSTERRQKPAQLNTLATQSNTLLKESPLLKAPTSPTPFVRESGQMAISSSFCACFNKKVESVNYYGECQKECEDLSDKKGLKGSLFKGSVVFSANTELNKFNSLEKWCETKHKCFLEVSSGNLDSPISLPLTFLSQESFYVDISGLAYGKSYSLRIISPEEKTTLYSNSIPFKKIDLPLNSFQAKAQEVLKTIPVHRYQCQWQMGYIDTKNQGKTVVLETYPQHYFYSDEPPTPLPPIPSGVFQQVFCHEGGGEDSSTKGRLKNISNYLPLWDHRDPRLMDISPANDKIDLNDHLTLLLKEKYNIESPPTEFFVPLLWPQGPSLIANGDKKTNSSSKILGFYLIPWISPETSKSFCPDESHWTSSSLAMFKELSTFIGVKNTTQALYVAYSQPRYIRHPEQPTTVTIPSDILFISERELEKKAYKYSNGQKISVSKDQWGGETIFFDEQDALGKTIAYKVSHFKEALGDYSFFSKIPQSIPAHDKRIGCIPL